MIGGGVFIGDLILSVENINLFDFVCGIFGII
jgi:hypothetical protein